MNGSKLDPRATELLEPTAHGRIFRFMKRNDMVYRRTTHHAQSTRNDPKIIQDWTSYMQNMCKTYDIKPDCIANFNETEVQFAVETRNTIAF
eukprot:scaffold4786_cov198-Amphora_coffeaeformis.AAC.18